VLKIHVSVVLTNLVSKEIKEFPIDSYLYSPGRNVIKGNTDSTGGVDGMFQDGTNGITGGSGGSGSGSGGITTVTPGGKSALDEKESNDYNNPYGGILDNSERKSNIKP
jgi:hypothetical protein